MADPRWRRNTTSGRKTAVYFYSHDCRNVIPAGLQATLFGPIWHASSRGVEACCEFLPGYFNSNNSLTITRQFITCPEKVTSLQGRRTAYAASSTKTWKRSMLCSSMSL